MPAIHSNSALQKNVGVKEVTGGKETNSLAASQVSSEAFKQALEKSLINSGMHNAVVAGSKYQLTADIVKFDQPIFGLNFTVSASVRYSLIETNTRKEVYSRVIPSSFTAGISDAFSGVERLKIANEGAIKGNIELFINDLLALKLD